MNKFRSDFVIFFLLISLTGALASGKEKVGSPQWILVYSAKPSSHSSSFLLKSPSGVTYRLSLIPEFDVEKHVVVLELVLNRSDKKRDDPNLLDSAGNLHGYQSYFFAASDFARGAQRSAYGDSRVIDLRDLGMELRVKVAQVNVRPTSPSSSLGPGYQFGDLTLEITTQSILHGSIKKSTR